MTTCLLRVRGLTMSNDGYVARKGEWVTDPETGIIVCTILDDIRCYDAMSAKLFGHWMPWEKPVEPHTPIVDCRWLRRSPDSMGYQIHIFGRGWCPE